MAKPSCGVAGVHRDLPFTVDTFDVNHGDKSQFLTHAHKDHAVNIENFGKDIWCTEVTRQLICIRFPALLRPTTKFHVLDMPDPGDGAFEDMYDEAQDVRIVPTVLSAIS